LLMHLVRQVTAHLQPRDLQQARLACESWRQGLSLGVAKLKPRMEANSLGLQWWQLHKLQVGIWYAVCCGLHRMMSCAEEVMHLANISHTST